MTHRTSRGLAVAAVGALALTGLATATPAYAAAPDAELISQYTGYASVYFDDVKLTAEVTPGTTVVFAVNTDPEAAAEDPGWTDIGTTTPTGRYATVSWSSEGPGGRSLVGERVALRVAATDATGTTYDVRRDVEVVADDSEVDDPALDSNVPYFTQPYADSGRTRTSARVGGFVSSATGTVELSSWRSDTGTFTGRTTAQVEPFFSKIPSGSVTGRFDGVLDIPGFVAADGLAVAAERGSDDVVSAFLATQTIGSISVASTPGTLPTGANGAVSLIVRDTVSVPVTGAEVRRASTGAVVGYTDDEGYVTTTQAAGATERYYVNATDADAFDAAQGDVETGDVTVPAYDPEPTDEIASYNDGDVFDLDEYAPGDVALLVTDQQGRPVGAGVPVQYQLYPSSGTAPAEYSTATTGPDGRAPVAFPADAASGEWTLVSRLGAADADSTSTFVVGEAEVLLNPKASPAVTTAGGQIEYVGRLVLDGEPLAGRRVDLTYRRGLEVVPGNQADAGIVTDAGRVLRSTVTTNANGSFRVTVDDLAETPQASEKGGVLTAATGGTVATEGSTVTGNAGARDTSTTSFGTAGPGLAKVVVKARSKGAAPDTLTVAGPTSLAGERVKVLRVAGPRRTPVATKRLNAAGDLPRVVARDLNGPALTTYVVQVVASQRVRKSDSNRVSVR